MSGKITLHRGGWDATKAELASVPVPETTDSYVPVPYGRFIEEIEMHVPRFDLGITDEAFALAREGKQMFGVLTCTNGRGGTEACLAIGVRNSYDHSLSVGLVAGARVFCCDNLAFSGEVTMARKHTPNVFRDLPDLIYKMLSQVGALQERQQAEIAAMRTRALSPSEAHHLMVHSIRAGALPASMLPRVLEGWDRPAHSEFMPRNAWSLYNAFTEIHKSRSPRAQMEDTLRLTSTFRHVLEL